MHLICESRKWKAEFTSSKAINFPLHSRCCKQAHAIENFVRVRKYRLGRFRIVLELKSTPSEADTDDSVVTFPHLQQRELSELPPTPEPSELNATPSNSLIQVQELPDLRFITPELLGKELLCELDGTGCPSEAIRTSNYASIFVPHQATEEWDQSNTKSEQYSRRTVPQSEPLQLHIEQSPSASPSMCGTEHSYTLSPVSPMTSSPTDTYDLTTQSGCSPLYPSTPQLSTLVPVQQDIAGNYEPSQPQDAFSQLFQPAYVDYLAHSKPTWTVETMGADQYDHVSSFNPFSTRVAPSYHQSSHQPTFPTSPFMKSQNLWDTGVVQSQGTAPIPQETWIRSSPSLDLMALGSHMRDDAPELDAGSARPLNVDGVGQESYPVAVYQDEDRQSYNYESYVQTLPADFPGLSCEECQTKFTGQYGKGNLARHRRVKHAKTKSTVGKTCRQCKQTFQRPDARSHHEWVRHGLGSEPKKRIKRH